MLRFESLAQQPQKNPTNLLATEERPRGLKICWPRGTTGWGEQEKNLHVTRFTAKIKPGTSHPVPYCTCWLITTHSRKERDFFHKEKGRICLIEKKEDCKVLSPSNFYSSLTNLHTNLTKSGFLTNADMHINSL